MTATIPTLRPVGFPSRVIPHVPHVKQQAGLLLDNKLEGLFGGAAGGGKSDWLLMAAAQYVAVPGYAALLLRKTYADLSKPGALIPRSKQWFYGKGRYNESSHTWTFDCGNGKTSTITFGFIRNDNDLEQYQSTEFQFIGFDELTHFSERQYTYMFSRLRKPKDGPLAKVPLRIRGATNPGGRGHEWVKLRFIESDKGVPVRHPDRFFLKSLLTDNPSLDRDMYMLSLEQLDEGTRAQLLHGDWNAREPGNWMIPDNRWVDASAALGLELAESGRIPTPIHHVIERGRDKREVIGLTIGIDWGEFTQAYTLWPLPGGGVYIPPSETIGAHEDPAAVSPRIIANGIKFGYDIADIRFDSAGIQSMRTFAGILRNTPGLERVPTTSVAFNKFKKLSINYLRLLFRRAYEGHETTVIAIHPENSKLLHQMKFWERKHEETEDAALGSTAKKVDDHGPDAVVAGVSGIAWRHQKMMDQIVHNSYTSDHDPTKAVLRSAA